jgi:hypothetical protein
MTEGRPPVCWLLYSHHLFELIRYLLPVATRLRARIRKEIILSGETPTLETVNERILGDDIARLSFALSMLDHVILELSGFVFARALKDKWLSPAPATRALTIGAIGEIQEFAEVPPKLKREGVLNLTEDVISGDPALIAVRLAVQSVDATLRKPEFLSSFRSSERKSRYLQSDQILRAYPEMVDQYDEYLSQSGTFTDWWKGGSPYQAVRSVLLN